MLARMLQPAIGIPIGNLTSQFFANIYLNGLDHYIKEDLQKPTAAGFGVIPANAGIHGLSMFPLSWIPAFAGMTNLIEESLLDYCEIRDKCRVYRTSAGVPFLGMVIFPGKRRLKRQSVMRFKRRLQRFQRSYTRGAVNWMHIRQSIQSWIGHAAHADTARLRELVLSDVVFKMG